MATMETAAGKTAMESGYDRPSPPNKFSVVDLGLRVLLFVLSLTALVVLVTSKQTTLIPVVFQPPLAIVSVAAKFNHSPALIYLLVALCVTCLHSLLTAISSLRLTSSSQAASTKTLFHLVLLDVLMAGIMASATGSAGAVAYIGLKGNSHTRWAKICGMYDKFCRHVGSSIALSLAASVILVVLPILSAHSLYQRSR